MQQGIEEGGDAEIAPPLELPHGPVAPFEDYAQRCHTERRNEQTRGPFARAFNQVSEAAGPHLKARQKHNRWNSEQNSKHDPGIEQRSQHNLLDFRF